jgi:hypothetical protein
MLDCCYQFLSDLLQSNGNCTHVVELQLPIVVHWELWDNHVPNFAVYSQGMHVDPRKAGEPGRTLLLPELPAIITAPRAPLIVR